jgi:hypothetical protein
MDMNFLVLPDQSAGPFWAVAAATLLVAAAALAGALTPVILKRLAAALPQPANDNEEGYASPRSRLRGV